MKRTLASIAIGALLLSGLSVGSLTPASADEPPSVAATAEERVVFEEDFSANDGARWLTHTAGSSEIRFAGGMAHVKGGGPENRMLSRDVVVASEFTLSLDFYMNEGNTNAAVKFGFLSDEQASNRHQLTYDAVNQLFRIERVVNTTSTVLATANHALGFNGGGEPHRISVTVEGDEIRASVNGDEVLSASDTGTASAAHGRILVASQFPAQDYAVDNIRVTTTEEEQVGEFEVALGTKTNGVIDESPESAGGTLEANRTTGNTGDEVSLTHTVRPGYVFDGYESYVTETGTSTDGLLTITNDRFTLDPKTGSVTIIARFVTAPEDPNDIFRDFYDEPLSDAYTVSDPTAVRVEDGALHIAPEDSPAHAIIDVPELGDLQNYQIQFSARKANGTAGTTQVAFRVGELEDRYVLALNGELALLRRFDSAGSNVELVSTLYRFDQEERTILIDVNGDQVSVSSDGLPVLSYTNVDDGDRDSSGWSGVRPGVAFINMTPGAPVAYDNVLVKRTPVYVGVDVEITNDGVSDPDLVSGTLMLPEYRTTSGSELTWTAFPKGGYELEGITFEGEPVEGNSVVVPEGVTNDVTLRANFVPTSFEARDYHIDSEAGDDANDGLTPATAWRSLSKLDRTFHPGDRILIKRGSEFDGEDAALEFRGSGTAGAPIVVSAYGEGPRPQLNGDGKVTNVVSLFNQEYIHIDSLEITNKHPDFVGDFELNGNNNRSVALRAVNGYAKDFGVVRGIRIRDLHIHDVTGNLDLKWNGGIFFNIAASIADGELHGVPTKFHDLVIEGNVLERVDRSGIKLVSSEWANQSLANSPNVPLNWYPSTGVVVRDNILRYMGGDAITVRDTDGALIEHNLARHSRYQNTGYNAGIWPFEATNTVVQFNEVSHTHGVQDGQGLDADHVSAYTVVQYNYSHDNEGGFMLIMNGFPHTAPTVRYNISQNDADKTFEFARGTPAGTMVHNNTIYSDVRLVGPRGGVLDLANTAAGTGNREAFFFNNVFHYPEGQPFYVGEVQTMKEKVRLFNNAYHGGITVPDEEEQAITADPLLPGPGTAPSDNADALAPLTGDNVGEHFAGYVPGEESTLRNAGVSIEDVVQRYGGTLTDRRDLAPDAIHRLALQGESIDFAAGRFLPGVDGVDYGRDFLGNPLPDWAVQVAADGDAEGITVGAIQYVPETAAPEDPEPTDPVPTDPVPTDPAPTTDPVPTAPTPTTTPDPTTQPAPTTDPEPTTGPEPSVEPGPSVAPTATATVGPVPDPAEPEVRPGLPATGAAGGGTGSVPPAMVAVLRRP